MCIRDRGRGLDRGRFAGRLLAHHRIRRLRLGNARGGAAAGRRALRHAGLAAAARAKQARAGRAFTPQYEHPRAYLRRS
eukprot:1553052-Alexandrium_andersonii.AAC.1